MGGNFNAFTPHEKKVDQPCLPAVVTVECRSPVTAETAPSAEPSTHTTTGGNANRAEIIAVMGMTGTGKTLWLMQRIARPKRKRLMVWSPKEQIDNYAARFGGVVVKNSTDALRIALASKKGPLCIIFSPPGARRPDSKLFSVFCDIARLSGNMTVIVEELHTVTQPSAAPEGWSKLCLMGRGYGVEIFALSQRPASCDKDFFGNCTLYHTGRLGYLADAKVMAGLINVEPGEIMNLPDLHYLEREPRAMGPAIRGIVKINPKK